LKKFTFLFLIITILSALPVSAAQSTTFTWALNRKDRFVRTQDAYLPERTVTGLMLKEPEDIFAAADGMLYISDGGNRRVVVYDTARDEVSREIRHEGFDRPRGIYVSAGLDLYVADSAAGAVFRFDKEGNLIQTFTRPYSAAFGDTPFAPMRIAADNRGSLYIVGEGVSNGIIQLSVTGEFLGFFTTNLVNLTFIQLLQNIFFTEAQRANLQDRVPGTFSNVHTDARGIVYTVTMGRNAIDNIKKHDMRGGNMFIDGLISSNSLSDVTTDGNGIIYVSDTRGWVFVYSPTGEHIFHFGGYSPEDIAGLYSYLTAVAVEEDGTVWTLDFDRAYLQSYRPTEYTLTIYGSLSLFNEGRYLEAEEQWNTVLRYNQASVLAHDGIGKASLYMQKYDEARKHFELAGNREYYSQAFWEIRNRWLQGNLVWILSALAVSWFLLLIVKYADRCKSLSGVLSKTAGQMGLWWGVRDVKFALLIMRHPIDGFYDLKHKIKGNYAGASFLMLTLFSAMMLHQTSKAYILRTTAVEDINLAALIGGFLGVVFLFITCNYLVTSINDGEGSIGDIFKMTAYASFPLSISFILVTVLSYALTFNEIFLVTFLLTAGVAWFCVIFYLGLQEIHNFNFRNTIKNILFTAGFILIAIIALLILTILFQQITQFIEALGRELFYFATGTI
jgi:DNA-binding beta-propeller fold protein YncE